MVRRRACAVYGRCGACHRYASAIALVVGRAFARPVGIAGEPRGLGAGFSASSFETLACASSSERENVSLTPANFTVLVWRTPSAEFSAESATEWRRATPIPHIAEAGLPMPG